MTRTSVASARYRGLVVGCVAILVTLVACDARRRGALEGLDNDDPFERVQALRTLAEVGDGSLAARIAPLVEDPSTRVRRAAIAALGAVGASDHLGVVVGRLRDRDLEVRLSAVRVLGDSGDEGVRGSLLRSLADSSMLVRAAAAQALVALGMSRRDQNANRARQMLQRELRALTAIDEQSRALAVRSIGLSGEQDAADALVQLTSARSSVVVEALGLALGRIGCERCRASLGKLARRRSVTARIAAARGAAALSPPDWPTLLHLLGRAQDAAVGTAALHAIAEQREAPTSPVVEAVCELLLVDARVGARSLEAARVVRNHELACAAQLTAWREEAQRLAARRDAGADPAPLLAAIDILGELDRDEDIGLTLSLAKKAFASYLYEAARWVNSDHWGQMQRVGNASTKGASSPARPGKGASRADHAAWLLARFPTRVGRANEDPLLPPRVRTGQIVAVFHRLPDRPETGMWTAELAASAPGPLRIAALERLSRLAPASSDDDEGVGGFADAAARAVEAGLASEQGKVRRAAATAVAHLGTQREEVALELLAHDDPGMRAAAARGLGAHVGTKAVPKLIRLLGRQRSPAFVAALGRIGDPRAAEPLGLLLKEEQPALVEAERLGVIEALGKIGGAVAAAALERELTHPSWQVRLAAAAALERGPRAESVAPLKVCEVDYYEAVRIACARTLRAASQAAER